MFLFRFIAILFLPLEKVDASLEACPCDPRLPPYWLFQPVARVSAVGDAQYWALGVFGTMFIAWVVGQGSECRTALPHPAIKGICAHWVGNLKKRYPLSAARQELSSQPQAMTVARLDSVALFRKSLSIYSYQLPELPEDSVQTVGSTAPVSVDFGISFYLRLNKYLAILQISLAIKH